MRQLKGVVAWSLAATLSGCLAHVTVSYSDDKTAAVRAALQQLRGELADIHTRLRPTRCGSENCYTTDDVRAAAETMLARLRNGFPSDALPLRIALEREVASMTSINEPVPLDGIQPASLRAAKKGYPTTWIDPFFDHFGTLLARLATAPELAPTVTIASEPAGATFDLEIPGTKVKKRTYLTNDQVPSVWRSVYQTTIRKDGYRDAHYTLNLMDDDRTHMTCSLVRVNETASSTCRVQ